MSAETVQLAVIMDPIGSIHPGKDSTLAMIAAAARRGWQPWVLGLGDLWLADGVAHGRGRPARVHPDVLADTDAAIALGGAWLSLGEPVEQPLAAWQALLMRKDPPFDMEYIYATYLLEQAASVGALVVNNPRSLRDCNEKLFATQFPQCCPPLLVSRDPARLRAFHAEHGDVVFKPLDGMGGASIFRIRPDDPNLGVVLETLTDHGRRQAMGQKFIPEISSGDKRVLLVDGEPVPYALARIPAKGETRGNLAAGGRGEGRPLTDRERWIAAQVGPELRRRGLHFVGIDVIGDFLTEVNVTCPTCIRELDRQFGLDIAGDLMAHIEQLLAKAGAA